jgi:hypothetical protein
MENKEDLAASYLPSPSSQPDYPCGLSISLTEQELDKLNLDYEDVKPGDLIHFHAMAVVTSVSHNANRDQEPQCRVELQITHMSAENEEYEDEEDEDEEGSENKKDRYSKLYGA